MKRPRPQTGGCRHLGGVAPPAPERIDPVPKRAWSPNGHAERNDPVPKRAGPIAGRYARDASIIVRTVACSSVRFSSDGIHCCVTTGTGSWNFAFSSSAYTCLGPSGAQP